MADLDDFFAKKDKKKSKGKKFMTTEEIAKKLEETGKKVEKPKKEKTPAQPQGLGSDQDELSSTITLQEDEEWKDFEEEKKDYSGLKIQNLTLQDYDDVDSNEGETEIDMEENEQGEMVPKKKGPWKVIENSDGAVVNYTAPVEKVKPQEPVAQVTGSKLTAYVPPNMRNVQQQAPRERNNRTKSGAPDITNQEFFPTLSAATTNELSGPWARRKQEGAFEEARNSKSHSNRSDSNRQAQSLQIDNKFEALDNEHS